MGQACRIAAVVPTYNRRAALERCLAALMQQTHPLDALFVVDNASTDGTEKMVQDRFSRHVSVIRLEDNSGSAGGFCEGIRAAFRKGYDWIWAMDNDAVPEPSALEELVKSPLFEDPRVGLLGSLILARNGDIQYGHSMRLSAFMKEIPAETEDSVAPVRLHAKSYAGALIHRRAIASVGFPRRGFFAYQDDLDYTFRISRYFALFLVPASRIIHENENRREFPERSRWLMRSRRWPFELRERLYYTMRNHIYFLTRSAPLYVVPVLLAQTGFAVVRKLAAILIFDDQRVARSRVIIRAACDGFAGRLGKASWL